MSFMGHGGLFSQLISIFHSRVLYLLITKTSFFLIFSSSSIEISMENLPLIRSVCIQYMRVSLFIIITTLHWQKSRCFSLKFLPQFIKPMFKISSFSSVIMIIVYHSINCPESAENSIKSSTSVICDHSIHCIGLHRDFSSRCELFDLFDDPHKNPLFDVFHCSSNLSLIIHCFKIFRSSSHTVSHFTKIS